VAPATKIDIWETSGFGALMLAYAEGDVIAGATTTADEYGIALRTISEYAVSVAAQRAAV
jgi:hypothetical protein